MYINNHQNNKFSLRTRWMKYLQPLSIWEPNQFLVLIILQVPVQLYPVGPLHGRPQPIVAVIQLPVGCPRRRDHRYINPATYFFCCLESAYSYILFRFYWTNPHTLVSLIHRDAV